MVGVWRVALLVAGAALIVASLFGAMQTRHFLARASQGDGVVTLLNAGGSHPQIAFRTTEGSSVTYPQGGMIAGYKVGQPVRVAYDATDPRGSARLVSFGSLWGGSLSVAALGLGLLVLGIIAGRHPTAFFAR